MSLSIRNIIAIMSAASFICNIQCADIHQKIKKMRSKYTIKLKKSPTENGQCSITIPNELVFMILERCDELALLPWRGISTKFCAMIPIIYTDRTLMLYFDPNQEEVSCNNKNDTQIIQQLLSDNKLHFSSSEKIIMQLYKIDQNNDARCSFFNIFKTNTTLTNLDIGQNNIKSDGAKHLSDALKNNTTLRALDLDLCSIDSVATGYIADSLKTNTTLTHLNLDRNLISDEGIKHIAGAFHVNTTLTALILSNNSVSKSGVFTLLNALKRNTTLTILY